MVVEIRTYKLHPGERDEFVRVMQQDALPLLERDGIRVVASGGSLVDEDGDETANRCSCESPDLKAAT